MNKHFQFPALLSLFFIIFIVVILLILSFLVQRKLFFSYAIERRWKDLGIHPINWKKILPVCGIILSVSSAIIALAGPIHKTMVPREKDAVILAVDISQSMGATDMQPSRIEVAKKAIAQFIKQAPGTLNIGLVTFDASAAGVINPTLNHESVLDALKKIQLGDGTATGAAINEARRMIEKFDEEVEGGDEAPTSQIILLSDGKQTAPSTDIQGEGGCILAARSARESNIKIYPVAIGTTHGKITLDGDKIDTPVDMKTLEAIAQISGGKVYSATTADELNQTYAQFGNVIGYESKNISHPFPWILISFVLLLGTVGFGLIANRRVL